MRLSKVEQALFHILACSLNGNHNYEAFPALSNPEWRQLHALMSRHGLVGILMIALECLPKHLLPPMDVLMEIIGQSSYRETLYVQQKATSCRFAKLLEKESVSCIVLKGLALSRYYPMPYAREFGDFDCVLSDFSQGNEIARRNGARVEDGTYKHSHISFDGLSIENHHYLTDFKGTKNGVRTEKMLQRVLHEGCLDKLEDTIILVPSADFNALFLTAHALGHFIPEGIVLKHVYDWASFLRTEQDNIDWKSVYANMDDCRLRRFCDVMTAICTDYLDFDLRNQDISKSEDSTLVEMVLDDILHGKSTFQTEESISQKAYRIFVRRFGRMWKYRSLATESFPTMVWNTFAFNKYTNRRIELSTE